MNKFKLIFCLSFGIFSNLFAQNQTQNSVTSLVKSEKHLSSSILLWMRTDKPRQEGMDRWKGPHSQIITANKGLYEYRQIHLAEKNTGLWPAIANVETHIPQDRKVDGVADVTLKNIFSIFRGKKQNKLAFQDEVNLFKRTILYAAFPKNSSWHSVNNSKQKIAARSLVFFRVKEGVDEKDFRDFIMNELTPTLANTGTLLELRSKVYNPWKQKQWDTPNVLHDNAPENQFQATLMFGFSDSKAMDDFYKSEVLKKLSDRIAVFCSAVHAYEIQETLTYIKDGVILPNYEK